MESKSNVQKQRQSQSNARDHQLKEVTTSTPPSNPLSINNRKSSEKDVHKPAGLGGGGSVGGGSIGSTVVTDEDRRGLKKVCRLNIYNIVG